MLAVVHLVAVFTVKKLALGKLMVQTSCFVEYFVDCFVD